MSIERIGSKSWEYEPENRSNQYLKKQANSGLGAQPSLYSSSLLSLKPTTETIPSIETSSKIEPKSKSVLNGAWNWVTEGFSTAGQWTQDKWDSFLVTLGFRKAQNDGHSEHQRARARIQERRSPLDIEEDFKYLDLSAVDPLKVMLALLIRQGELHEEQAFLVQQKILLMQEDLKDIHNQRMEIQAELVLVGKHNAMIEKVTIGITAAQVISGMVSTAAVVAGAATIATGGAAAPFLVVTGALGGVVAGAQAVNTWLRADSKDKLNKLQAEMMARNAKRDEFQFQIRVDVKDMKKILNALTGHAEIGSALLSAQLGK